MNVLSIFLAAVDTGDFLERVQEALALADTAGAIASLSEYLGVPPDSAREFAIDSAYSLADLGILKRAEAWALLAVLSEKDNPDALSALAYVYSQQGNNWKALRLYSKALKLDSSATNFYNLAYVYDKMGDYEVAKDLYKAALKRTPADESIHLNLGNVFWNLGDTRGAEAHYREALRLKPDYYNAAFNLALLYKEYGKYKAALHWALKAYSLDSSDYSVYMLIAGLYESLWEYEKEAAVLRKAWERFPDSAQVGYYLAKAYKMAGDTDAAFNAYREVIERFPRYGQAYAGIAELLGASTPSEEGDSWNVGNLSFGTTKRWGFGLSYDSRYFQETIYREELETMNVPAVESYAWWGFYGGQELGFFATLSAAYPLNREDYGTYDNYSLDLDLMRYFDGWTLNLTWSTRYFPRISYEDPWGDLQSSLYGHLAGGVYVFPKWAELSGFAIWFPGDVYLYKGLWIETSVQTKEWEPGRWSITFLDTWQRWDFYNDLRDKPGFGLDVAGLRSTAKLKLGHLRLSASVGYVFIVDREPNDPQSGPYWSASVGWSSN